MGKVVIMPKLGYTQDEGELIEWYKAEGETVRKGEAFFEVQTDKTVIRVDATEDGTVLKLLAEPGTVMPVFTPIAVVGQPGENPEEILRSGQAEGASASAAASAPSTEPGSSAAAAEDSEAEDKTIRMTPRARRFAAEQQLDLKEIAGIKGTGYEGGITERDIKASPLAKKMAPDLGVDLRTVQGSGAQGKIRKADVLRAAAAAAAQEKPGLRIAEETPYRGTRRVIGERLSGSKREVPHAYFSDSVDTGKLTALRSLINEKGEYRVSISDLLIVAAAKALRRYPGMNVSLQGDCILRYESINIGTAVAGEAGLIVPVVKNVQDKTLRQIAAETRELFPRAQKGQLRPEEYSGGTFTVSNLGMTGIEDFCAIVNPPEAGILAVSAIRKKPVVVTGEDGEDRIEIRPMMNIRLSADHRLVDGLLAAQFVHEIKRLLEEPTLLLL